MIGSSRSYAIGMAHFQLAGGFKSLVLVCGVYLALFGAGTAGAYYLAWTTHAPLGAGMFVPLLLGIEALVLLIFGSLRVSGAIRTDISSGMIESHRLMPVPSWRAVLGYILGGATHAIAFALVNLALAYVFGGLGKISILQVTINQMVLFCFAGMIWGMAAVGTFQFRYMAIVGLALLVFGGCGIVYAYIMLPGIALLMSPLHMETIFTLSPRSVQSNSMYGASIVAQAIFFILFFNGACRRYRGTFATTFSVLQSFLLLAAWCATSAVGIYAWTTFHFAADSFRNENTTFRSAQVVASVLSAMFVALIPLRTFTLDQADNGAAWWKTLVFLIGLTLSITLIAVSGIYVGEGHPGALMLTLCVAGAFVCSVYAAMCMLRNARTWVMALVVLGGVLAAWMIPLLLEFMRVAMFDSHDVDPQMGVLGTLSPAGLLTSFWTTREPPSPVAGIVWQWMLAGILGLLAGFLGRRKKAVVVPPPLPAAVAITPAVLSKDGPS